MELRWYVLAALFVFSSALALPAEQPLRIPRLRPLVIWHGLGDSYAAPGMLDFVQEVKDMHPGLFVHTVYLDESNDEDRRATWVRRLHRLDARREGG